MFKTVKRIISWCGEFKGKLYAGFVFSFFSHWFAALPIAVAAYTIGLLIEAEKTEPLLTKMDWTQYPHPACVCIFPVPV